MTFYTKIQQVQNHSVLALIKKDAFIKIHHKFRYLVLFDYGLCDKIFDKIKYLIREKE